MATPRAAMLGLGLVLALATSAAHAQRPVRSSEAKFYPQWNNAFEINLRLDGTFASQNRESRFANLSADVEWRSALHFDRRWSIQTLVQLEQLREPTRAGVFRDHGVFLRNLFVNYAGDGFTVYGGKYDPDFGTLWSEDLPGLFTNSFSEEYQFTEGLGVGGSHVISTIGYGEHELGFNLFMFDNTALSNSAFTRPAFGAFDTGRPGRLRFANGGPGNTRAPTSFTATLNGGDFIDLPGLSYHLGFARLARGSDGEEAEPSRDVYGLAAAARWTRRLAPEWQLSLAAEGVWFWRVNLGEDEAGAAAFGRRRLLTALAALEYDQSWLLSVAGTLRSDNTAAAGLPASQHDWLLTASLEYMPVRGMRLGIGYRAVREVPLVGDDTRQYTNHMIGVRLRYVFATPAVVLGR